MSCKSVGVELKFVAINEDAGGRTTMIAMDIWLFATASNEPVTLHCPHNNIAIHVGLPV